MASVFLTQSESKTLAVGLYGLIAGERNANFGMFAAGTLLTAIPTVVLFYSSSGTSSAASPPARSRADRAPDGGHAEEPPRLGPPRRLDPLRAAGRGHRPRPAAATATRSGCACGRASTRPVDRVFLRTAPDGEQALEALVEVAPGPACRWFEIVTRLTMPVTDYRFLVVGPAGTWWLTGRGLRGATETDRDDFRLVVGFDPPSWLADRVFYQVFPDRFENGDAGNDVHDARGSIAASPPDDAPGRSGRPTAPGGSVEFFGGDLAGRRGPARPPRRPRGQRDLPQPRLRLAVEPRLRHDRLRARRRALRRRRGPRVPAPRDPRARHPR